MQKLMRLSLMVLAPAVAMPAWAQSSDCGKLQGSASILVPFASESITISSTALGFTMATAFPAAGNGAQQACVTVAVDSVRYWPDGTIPSATVGHIADSGSSFSVGVTSLRAIRFIRVTTDAILSVTYMRPSQ